MGCSVLATALAEVCAEGRLDFRVRASFTCCLLQLVQHRRAVWCRERLGCVHATLLPFARNNTEMKLKPSQDRIRPCVGTEAGAAPAFALLGGGGGEGSQQVTFQGIRQTVGIKGFTWQ